MRNTPAENTMPPITLEGIEQICRERAETSHPAEAFLIGDPSVVNCLLAAYCTFLEEGENLRWPGLVLLGATFNLSWGFSTVDVVARRDGSRIFEPPSRPFEEHALSSTSGYRFCPVDSKELPRMLHELANVRKGLASSKESSSGSLNTEVIVVDV
jgi:hypothetical protein